MSLPQGFDVVSDGEWPFQEGGEQMQQNRRLPMDVVALCLVLSVVITGAFLFVWKKMLQWVRGPPKATKIPWPWRCLPPNTDLKTRHALVAKPFRYAVIRFC